ncbi:MAG: gliding motility-associated C-terminal domain-containing protein [Bacteroidota bacterium]
MRFSILGLLCLCLLRSLGAQECVPDPGPPLFFEDFGSGPNPGPPLEDGLTTFAYGSIDEGRYVVSNTTALNLANWHDGVDNTEGDTDGYMLIFNATDGPGVFYQMTFTDLCPNTDYIAVYHVANVSLPGACIGFAERPNVRVSALDPTNEAVQFTEATGEIWYSSLLTWWEYSLRFRTDDDQTSVLIRLANEAPGGCGNDLAIDDVSLHLCNLEIEQTFDLCDLPDGGIMVGENLYTSPGTYTDAVPIPNSCNDTLFTTTLTGPERRLPPIRYTICEGDTLEIGGQMFADSISFVDTLANSDPDCPQLQPVEIVVQPSIGATQDVVLCGGDSILVGNNWYRTTGTYVDSLQSSTGCDSVVITSIIAGAIDIAVSPASVDLDFGASISLTSTVDLSDDFTLSWQPPEAFSCANCPDPIFQPAVSQIYQVVATDNPSGCTASASIEVLVRACEKVFVPNAFSPNFDAINDELTVFAEPCFTRLISWRIFDRWGGQVYEVADQAMNGSFIGWDGQARGQEVEQGVYSYQLVLERTDGAIREIKGEVMLLR